MKRASGSGHSKAIGGLDSGIQERGPGASELAEVIGGREGTDVRATCPRSMSIQKLEGGRVRGRLCCYKGILEGRTEKENGLNERGERGTGAKEENKGRRGR